MPLYAGMRGGSGESDAAAICAGLTSIVVPMARGFLWHVSACSTTSVAEVQSEELRAHALDRPVEISNFMKPHPFALHVDWGPAAVVDWTGPKL